MNNWEVLILGDELKRAGLFDRVLELLRVSSDEQIALREKADRRVGELEAEKQDLSARLFESAWRNAGLERDGDRRSEQLREQEKVIQELKAELESPLRPSNELINDVAGLTIGTLGKPHIECLRQLLIDVPAMRRENAELTRLLDQMNALAQKLQAELAARPVRIIEDGIEAASVAPTVNVSATGADNLRSFLDNVNKKPSPPDPRTVAPSWGASAAL